MKYQDPSAADKILKIQRELDDTKVVLHKTIDSVLAREKNWTIWWIRARIYRSRVRCFTNKRRNRISVAR